MLDYFWSWEVFRWGLISSHTQQPSRGRLVCGSKFHLERNTSIDLFVLLSSSSTGSWMLFGDITWWCSFATPLKRSKRLSLTQSSCLLSLVLADMTRLALKGNGFRGFQSFFLIDLILLSARVFVLWPFNFRMRYSQVIQSRLCTYAVIWFLTRLTDISLIFRLRALVCVDNASPLVYLFLGRLRID